MCEKCGCGNVESFNILPMQEPPEKKNVLIEEGQWHSHGGKMHRHGLGEHSHEHEHPHEHDSHAHVIEAHMPILAQNSLLAERNRGFLKGKGLFAINIVSSPGSGKTTFAAKTLEMLGERLPAIVIVGDLETANDAARLRGKGAPVAQVTTGTVCHLDAEMVARSLEQLDLEGRKLLIIENVGNLVCPAAYDLGENMRVVLFSVTEGEDKPLKYPPIFRNAQVVIISKMDLAAATGCDMDAVRKNIRSVAPEARILEVSARTGEGMEGWTELLIKAAG